jgi:hypothetical protein
LTRAGYLNALANRVDSFWVPDHLNGLFPRSLWKQKYCGATKLVPTLDAYMEPWTMLGHLAARNRVGRKLIDKVEAPNGLNPAPIPQGSESRGTLYFDVTGAPPNGVVYNDGLQDILIWTSNVPGASAPGAPNSGPTPGAPPGPSAQS